MALILKQWTGSTITPQDDALLYAHFETKSGILKGFTCTITNNNTLNIGDGWGLCCGREFANTAETKTITLSSSGTIKGRLIVDINTSTSPYIQFIIQTGATLPALIQQDLNNGGTNYQIAICTFDVGTASCTNLVMEAVLPTKVQKGEYEARSITGADIDTYTITDNNIDPLAAIQQAKIYKLTEDYVASAVVSNGTLQLKNKNNSALQNLLMRMKYWYESNGLTTDTTLTADGTYAYLVCLDIKYTAQEIDSGTQIGTINEEFHPCFLWKAGTTQTKTLSEAMMLETYDITTKEATFKYYGDTAYAKIINDKLTIYASNFDSVDVHIFILGDDA